ncbi:MAG: hypothetical protein QOG84_1787 [Sphingomonadales bacterium]|nr:hypothetical protein [Sphingomonadales bacterium]
MAGSGKLILLMSWSALIAAQPPAPIPVLPPATFEIVNDTDRPLDPLLWRFEAESGPSHDAGQLGPGGRLRLTADPSLGCRLILLAGAPGRTTIFHLDRCTGRLRIDALMLRDTLRRHSRHRMSETGDDTLGGSSQPVPPPPPPPPPPPAPSPPPILTSAAPPRIRVHTQPRVMAAPPAPIVAAAPPGEAPPPPAAAATAYCDVLQDEATAEECNYYTGILGHLKQGSAGLRAPASMRVGETAQVSLALTRDEKSTSVETALGAAPTQRFAVRVGRRMAAELTATGFTIKPPARIEKDLGIGDAARWEWNVTAEPGREHQLTATVYVIVRKPGVAPVERLVTTAVQPVKVTVPFVQRSEGWMDATSDWLGHLNKLQAALGAVASGAVATWLIAWWRKRRGGGKPPA